MASVLEPVDRVSADERRHQQGARLHALVERLAACGSPYWTAKLAGVAAAEIASIDDLAALPFTVKSELRESFPFGMLAVPRTETVRVHASSGTRGKPTVVAYTRADVGLFAEVNARVLALAGGVPDDVLHVAYGYGLFTGGLGLHFGGEHLGATVVPASGGNPALQVQLMADLGANGLACTPSFGMLLAERAAADGLMERIRGTLRYGVFGAEPWSAGFRAKLEEAWGGIDACDIYGLSEVIGPGVAAECREAKDGLHVFEDHFYPEILAPLGDQPVEPGETGELVITTLTKEALPVIRYRTGDLTSWVEGECACGRTFRRIGRFTGRVDDMLVVRGINVFPSEIEAVLMGAPELAGQYAIVVDRRPTLPELAVCSELKAPGSPEARQGLAERVGRQLQQRLRLRVRVVLVDPGGIPRQEVGKARRVFEVSGADDAYAAIVDG